MDGIPCGIPKGLFRIMIAYPREWIKNTSRTMKRDELEQMVFALAEKTGYETFREQAAHEILRITRPEDVIPHVYSQYRQIVHDGIFFLLSHLSAERLVRLGIDQILMEDDADIRFRLIELAKAIPTLHKLGQTIARNRHVDPSFKQWLIQLEEGIYGTDTASVSEKIQNELGSLLERYSIRLEGSILAEASVGVVMPFTWTDPDTGNSGQGVFKILKPDVREKLGEELNLLDEAALFFERNKERYPLRDFRFIETFKDIKEALEAEMNLPGEQVNLKKASDFYRRNGTRIPGILPFSTPHMTAMNRTGGCKLTDSDMSPFEKKKCARRLFKTIIWQPLCSWDDKTIFHGDPHAGNIHAFRDPGTGEMKEILLDWCQAGSLSKSQRIHMMRMAMGIAAGDEQMACDAVKQLSAPDIPGIKIEHTVKDIMSRQDDNVCGFVEKTFRVIDQAALKGIRFPRDLLLFRKAFFTVEGVLYDLDPEFDMDGCMITLIAGLLTEELPLRWICALLPQFDNPELYILPVSNKDLQLFGLRVGMGAILDHWINTGNMMLSLSKDQ
jgi:ubiquinone biosynthesis protein